MRISHGNAFSIPGLHSFFPIHEFLMIPNSKLLLYSHWFKFYFFGLTATGEFNVDEADVIRLQIRGTGSLGQGKWKHQMDIKFPASLGAGF